MPASAGRSRERGFTLIEIMVSMVLAAIAIVGILGLYMTQTKAAGFSRHSTEASVLAQDMIEKLRTTGAASNQSGTNAGINERGLTGGIFTRTWTEALSTFATITVTVTWSDDGATHTLTQYAVRDP
jgi:type IV pilus assembly protein PilV